MEISDGRPYTFEMLLKVVKKRWLVAPLAALFLIFSGGAAVAPDCHIIATDVKKSPAAPINSHASHTHSHEQTVSLPSNLIEPLVSVGGVLNNEVCFIVGFIVLLLIRFARGAKVRISALSMKQQVIHIPRLIASDLGFLKVTHLKLGIIRI